MASSWLAAAAILAGFATAPATAQTLDDLRWKARILVLVAPSDSDASLLRQRDAIAANRAALAERDLLVFALAGDRILPVFGNPPPGETAASLSRRLDLAAAPRFEAILIGKDGGVKWRRDAPVPLAEILGVIDAMPMRRGKR